MRFIRLKSVLAVAVLIVVLYFVKMIFLLGLFLCNAKFTVMLSIG